jgi:hypothetical protein
MSCYQCKKKKINVYQGAAPNEDNEVMFFEATKHSQM